MTQLETHTDRFVCVFQSNYQSLQLRLRHARASAASKVRKRDLKRFIYASFVCFFNNMLVICRVDEVFC